MESVMVSIIFDGAQETHQLPLIQQNGEYFVANPHAEISHQLALVRLDPKRLGKPPENGFPMNYTGILLEIQTLPKE